MKTREGGDYDTMWAGVHALSIADELVARRAISLPMISTEATNDTPTQALVLMDSTAKHAFI